MSELAPIYEREATETTVRQIGRTALWGGQNFEPELGINDPLTHLEQFLEVGETAMDSVAEDLITDIAERKLKPTFINPIEFDKVGDDFISRQNKFSMRKMTAITKDKFAKDKLANFEQYRRAKIESSEVQKLNDWFETAQNNDNFIVESLPLGQERYSIVRIYQKAGPAQLVEQVVTLHGASVETFNQLRQMLGATVPAGNTALEVLANMYVIRPLGSGFENDYVAAYDKLLASKNPGHEFSFGLPKNEQSGDGDDIENVRRQTALRKVYLDMVSALGTSGGYASKDIIAKAKSLDCRVALIENEKISYETARQLLDTSLQSVVATFNRASKDDLDALAVCQDSTAAAGYAGHYGGEARAEGIRYDGACPSSTGTASAESTNAAHAYRHNKSPSQCGECPHCKKEYFVDPKVYKANILECNNCHERIGFDGKPVSQEKMDKLHNRRKVGFIDSMMDDLAKYNRKFTADEASKKALKKAQQQVELASAR